MENELDLILRLHALKNGHARLRTRMQQVVIEPHAKVLAALALAGEDTTIHMVALGDIGQRPQTALSVPDPRNRNAQYWLFEQLARALEPYFARCLQNGEAPQVWVSSSPTVTHLDALAERLRYNQQNARVQRLGELLSYLAMRAPIAGQLALMAATSVLQQHWATGQQAGEDGHLFALLTWITPPLNTSIQDAVRRAEALPAGVKTDPDFDRVTLVPLLNAYNRARKRSASQAELARRKQQIDTALRPIVDRIYNSTQRAISLLRAQQLPLRPDLQEWQVRERDAFQRFMAARAQRLPLSLHDSPRQAAYGLAEREEAQENLEAARLATDRAAQASGRLAGRVVEGVVRNPQQRRTAPRRTAYTFELDSAQTALRARQGDTLYWADDPRLCVEVVSVTQVSASLPTGALAPSSASTITSASASPPSPTTVRALPQAITPLPPVTLVTPVTATIRITLRIKKGQRAVGLPAAGRQMTLLTAVPDWGRSIRQRGTMKARLVARPWTHATPVAGGSASMTTASPGMPRASGSSGTPNTLPAATPSAVAMPIDPLAAVEALR